MATPKTSQDKIFAFFLILNTLILSFFTITVTNTDSTRNTAPSTF